MSKAKQSKLDAFTERLDEWFGLEKKTLKEVAEQLRLDGCVVSLSRLGAWWERRQQKLNEEKLLSQIASGAQQCKQVRSEFSENAPPDLQMLIDLHRVLVMQMSTQAATNPDMIKLADQGLRTVMEFVSGQTKARFKERELTLAEEKFQFDAAKACLAQLPALKQIAGNKTLSETDKIQAIRQRLWGKVLPHGPAPQ